MEVKFTPTFEAPGRGSGWKKLKTFRMESRDGLAVCEVPVYLSTAGTPSFGVPLMQELRESWEAHRDDRHEYARYTKETPHMLYASDFNSVARFYEKMVFNHLTLLRNMAMEKCIGIKLELNIAHEGRGDRFVPGIKVNHNSFSRVHYLVGTHSHIVWTVNGKTYTDHGNGDTGDRAARLADEGTPLFEDLSPSRDYDTVIPYTEQAWATLKGIEATLANAAKALQQLTKPEQAALLLASGTLSLAGPKETP